MTRCPLCEAANAEKFFEDKNRSYFRCRTCSLTFVLSECFLSSEEEKKRYDLHQNDPHDEQYRSFLNRLFQPLQKRLVPQSRGLDFGSGPGPTLSVMFEEAGHSMAIYDRFYAEDPTLLETTYDFITATEVLEHLREPQKELARLWGCLRPGGCLGIMTKLALGAKEFSKWHYKDDETHICFFSKETFTWLAAQWRAKVTFEDKDVIIFQSMESEKKG